MKPRRLPPHAHYSVQRLCSPSNKSVMAGTSNPVVLVKSKEEFEALVKDEKAVLAVEFFAAWSEGSKQMTAVGAELAAECPPSAVRFVRVEAEGVPEISLRYGITAVPTFVFLHHGAVLDRVDGVHAAQLTAKVRQLKGGALPALPPRPNAAPAVESKEDLDARLKALINRHKCMLFMKGNPDAPQCGFSRQVVALLRSAGADFGSFDILSDEAVRAGLKAYSNWPTYPQIYVDGELLGGLDILQEMEAAGELKDALPKAMSLDDRLKALIKKAPVMVFMKGIPQMPKCKFSRALMEILQEEKVPFDTFDILEDNDVREGLKKLSNWPTYPQVYVKGELVGGIDIIKELKEGGELASTLKGQ